MARNLTPEEIENYKFKATERYVIGWTDPKGILGSSEVTPEAKVKKHVKDILEAMDVYYTMPATGGYGNSGTPDFLCCAAGQFLAIECKAGNNQPTALQLRDHEKVRAAGGKVLVINEDGYDTLAVTIAAMKGNNHE